MVRLVSSDTGLALDKDPNLLLQDYIKDNWPTADNVNYPGLLLKDKIAFGAHYRDRAKWGKNNTLIAIQRGENPYRYLNPGFEGHYGNPILLDIFINDSTTDSLSPKITMMKNWIRDFLETNPHGLRNKGIHSIEYDNWSYIQQSEQEHDEHVWHIVINVRVNYWLTAI